MGCRVIDAAAATPNTMPIRPGLMPSEASYSATTGSSIEIVAAPATTAAAHAATAGARIDGAHRHALVAHLAGRQIEPGERHRPHCRHHRDGDERQPHPAQLVQPAAKRRPDHESKPVSPT